MSRQTFKKAGAMASKNLLLETIPAQLKARFGDATVEKVGGLTILVIFVLALVVMVFSSITMFRAKRVGIVPTVYYTIFLLPVGQRLLKEAMALYS